METNQENENTTEAQAPEASAAEVQAAAVASAAAEADEDVATERNARKERVGIVVSHKMEKTITVAVRRQMKHPMYGKYLERSTKLMAHDETNEAAEGDTVRIIETRPLSKHKRWRLAEIIERAQ